MNRYRAEGALVYQGDAIIARCDFGDQGQAAEAIAERIAALLNDDFEAFCMAIAATVGGGQLHGMPASGALDDLREGGE